MDVLEESYTVKPSSIGQPKLYIGADIDKVKYPDGSYTLTMTFKSYTRETIKNVN